MKFQRIKFFTHEAKKNQLSVFKVPSKENLVIDFSVNLNRQDLFYGLKSKNIEKQLN